MFTLVTFPWPLPSANVPLIEMSSRSGLQAQQPTRSAVTARSLTTDGQDGPASETEHRESLLAPQV